MSELGKVLRVIDASCGEKRIPTLFLASCQAEGLLPPEYCFAHLQKFQAEKLRERHFDAFHGRKPIHYNMRQMATRPILRWAGSKRKLLPSLIDCVPESFERYVEPFLGSGCFFLALRPSVSVLGDFNRGLMEMYSVLRASPLKLARAVYAMPNTTRHYYKLRSHAVADLTALERAARFVYLNRYCFNGVYRENRKGMFNVPRGRHTGKLPTIEEFKECAEIFKNADLRPGDFEECLSDTKSGDFIYLDPPYASCTRLDHGEYGYNSFNEKDIPRLISTLKSADKKGAVVLLSYANTPLLKRVLPKWNFRKVRVRRNVAGFIHKRLEVSEVLVSNYPFPQKPTKVS